MSEVGTKESLPHAFNVHRCRVGLRHSKVFRIRLYGVAANVSMSVGGEVVSIVLTNVSGVNEGKTHVWAGEVIHGSMGGHVKYGVMCG